MAFFCENCNKDTETVLIDGYAFGDRLLEGVHFKVSGKPGAPVVDGVVDEDRAYFENLNAKKWLQEAQEFAEGADFARCPVCGGDVTVEG